MISNIIKRHIWEKYKGHCFYCGKKCVKGPKPGVPQQLNTGTMDHLQPRSKGGPDTSDNLVLACLVCNVEKREKSLEEYRTSKIINGENYLFYYERQIMHNYPRPSLWQWFLIWLLWSRTPIKENDYRLGVVS